ncbi:MAG: glycosyltransferase family A protein [Flavobacteriales bacterium]
MDALTVSVCCVTFEQKDRIARALDSFLAQRVDFPIEIIVHDDASTDGTADIVRAYAAQHPGIIRAILQRENKYSKGIKPFTIAFAQARGRYIATCDGDDFWTDPEKLKQQVALLDSRPDAAGCFHWTEMQQGGRFTGKTYGAHGERTEFGVEETMALLSPFHISSFMFRNVPMEFPSWFGTLTSSDMALFSMVAANGPLLCIQKVMSVYDKHGHGVSASIADDVRFHDKRIALLQHLDEYHGFAHAHHVARVIAEHRTLRKRALRGGADPVWRRLLRKLVR